MNETSIRGRFAPSPSGRLHLGNMLSSLLAWLDVRSLGGEMVFRLEDLDPDRSTRENALLMAEDLEWLGLDWDIGWRPGEHEDYMQSRRSGLYLEQFNRMREENRVYPCFCTRAQRLAASAPHPGEEREIGCGCHARSEEDIAALIQSGRKPSYKMQVDTGEIRFTDGHYGLQTAQLNQGADDFIIRRADGVFAYQFAVSYDDAVMGISRVVRGCDLLSSTPKQIWLIRHLGYPAPTYCHAPMIVTEQGRKMSKREGGLTMEVLREKNTPAELCGKLAYTAGIIDRPEPITPRELISLFSWDKVKKDPISLPDGLYD